MPYLTLLMALLVSLLAQPGAALLPTAAFLPDPERAASAMPVVVNPGFECVEGYHSQPGINGMAPNGWTAVVLEGNPHLTSTQTWVRGRCDPTDGYWEKIEGYDSAMFMASYAPYGYDFPAPPFDAVLFQQVAVTPGEAYSLSAWMVSLCGGSAMPSDCPVGAYISKAIGIDPTGDTNPLAATVAWQEDRRPHYETRWLDFSPVTVAQSGHLTLFVRVRSPFNHHGNHAFADAVKLVRAPLAQVSADKSGQEIRVSYAGDMGEDIRSIGGIYRVYLDVQVSVDKGPWKDWLTGQDSGSSPWPAPIGCGDVSYRFRTRAIVQQPVGQKGAWPPHRFTGLWQESDEIIQPGVECTRRTFLPVLPR